MDWKWQWRDCIYVWFPHLKHFLGFNAHLYVEVIAWQCMELIPSLCCLLLVSLVWMVMGR